MAASEPSRETAERLINEAAERRRREAPSGFDEAAWRAHSFGVARLAERIASRAGLDAEKAFVSGLLHDIGKRWNETQENVFHSLSGYHYMAAFGFKGVARICLTHSFPLLHSAENLLPNPDALVNEARGVIETFGEYDDFDRLIQLCDWLNDCGTDCSVEYRAASIIRRYPEIPARKTLILADTVSDLKKRFDALCGEDVCKICGIPCRSVGDARQSQEANLFRARVS